MLEAKLAKHFEAMPNLIAPVRVMPIELSGAYDAPRDGGKKIALAAEMVVERHWRDADGVSQATHGDRIGAGLVDKRQGSIDHLVAREITRLSP
jgi:hypothetical protein